MAVKLDGKNVSLHLALADASLQANRPQRARDTLNKILELDPANARAATLREQLPK